MARHACLGYVYNLEILIYNILLEIPEPFSTNIHVGRQEDYKDQ